MIDVGRMISMMGCNPEEMIDAGLLKPNQKPKPRFSGDDELVLNMKKEGVTLFFERRRKILHSISLKIVDKNNPKYRFPNELPRPLNQEMTKEYVIESMGKPYESRPPVQVLNEMTGGVDHYILKRDIHGGLSQLVYYTKDQRYVKSLTYMYTRDVSWGRSG